MQSEQVVLHVKKLADQLGDIQERLERVELPREVLEDFKRAIDSMRITLWATLSLSEAELAEGVAHFRLRRTEEMCRQVELDMANGRITKRNPDLQRFHATLKETLGCIEGLQEV